MFFDVSFDSRRTRRTCGERLDVLSANMNRKTPTMGQVLLVPLKNSVLA